MAVYVGLSPVAPPKPEATDPDGLADEEEEYDEGDLVEADRLRSAVQVVQNIFDRCRLHALCSSDGSTLDKVCCSHIYFVRAACSKSSQNFNSSQQHVSSRKV